MKYNCPHCGQHLESGASMAGERFNCPACNKPLLTPPASPTARRGAPDPWGTPASANASAPAGGGGAGVCPTPTTGGTTPADPADAPPVDESGQTIIESTVTRQSGINRSALTISQYMAEHGLDGAGISLSSTGSSAAEILTAEDGRKYDMGRVVAEGGMGAIIDARDRNLRRSVAMKVLLNPKQVSRTQLLRFIEEAQVTAQLQHPGIVPTYELGVDASGNPFYTMKMIRGQTLRAILEKIRDGDAGTLDAYPLPRLLTVFQRVCDAMAFAHSKRVIHRDLKPENIMVGEYGETLVMDWGLAKILPGKNGRKKNGTHGDTVTALKPKTLVESVRSDRTMTGDGLKTLDGMVMGTPQFMAPEQARGEIENLDERTDIYALGAILYNILTLNPPISGRTIDQMLENVVTGNIQHPSTYQAGRDGSPVFAQALRRGKPSRPRRARRSRPTPKPAAATVRLAHCAGGRIPDALIAVTLKALALDPKDRYPKVVALQRDIEAYQTGFAVSAEQASMWRQLGLLIRRHKTATALVGSIGMLIFVGLLSFAWIARSEQRRALTALALLDEQQRRMEAWLPVVAADFAAGDPIPDGFEPLWCHDTDREMYPAEDDRITIVDGALTFREAGLKILRWAEPVGANIQVDVWVPDQGTLQIAVAGDAATGYRAVFDFGSSRTVWLDEGAGQAWRIHQRGRLPIPERETHHLRVQKTGQHIKVLINDALVLDYFDPISKSGLAHRNFSISSWARDARVFGIAVHRRRDPEYVSVLEAGRELLRRGHFADAKDFFETQLVSRDDSETTLQARLLLGVTFARLDRSQDAVRTLERVVAEAGRETAIQGAALYELTRLRVDAQHWEQAVATALRARALDPGSQAPDLVVNRVIAYLRANAVTESVDQSGITDQTSSKLSPEQQSVFLRYLGRLDAKTLDLSLCGLVTLEGVGSPRLRHLYVNANQLTDLTPLEGLQLQTFRCGANQVTDLSPLAGMPLVELLAYSNDIQDLSPLAGMPLKVLWVDNNNLAGLSPLAGMELTQLRCHNNRIRDLTPLKGMPLRRLDCGNNQVEDLAPIAGIPLVDLRCGGNQIRDLSPLAGMPLQHLECSHNRIADISPLAGMPLRILICNNNHIDDLSVLKGMPLERLVCGHNRITDLTSLAGMPLYWLGCTGNQIHDLSPLAGLPLRFLGCSDNHIRDLSALAGMPLQTLIFSGNQVRDLNPLTGMPLRKLECIANQIEDLSPLAGMPLADLHFSMNPVSDLSPLNDMPVTSLVLSGNMLTPKNIEILMKLPLVSLEIRDLAETPDVSFVNRMDSLAVINGVSTTHLPLVDAVRRSLRGEDVDLREYAGPPTHGVRWLLIPEFMTYTDATAFAQRQGGRLACPSTRERFEALLDYGLEFIDQTRDVHIGAFRDLETDQWRWQSGAAWDDTLWYSDFNRRRSRDIQSAALWLSQSARAISANVPQPDTRYLSIIEWDAAAD